MLADAQEPGDPARELDRLAAAVKAAALKLLEVQLRPRRELGRRLAARGFPASVIETVLDRLSAVGLVDDRVYAEGFVRRRLRLRPCGRLRLTAELRARGIPEPIAAAAIREATGAGDELELARAALAARAGRWARLDPEVARRRAAAALKRLGFPVAVITAVLARKR
jgi:regulatory protein